MLIRNITIFIITISGIYYKVLYYELGIDKERNETEKDLQANK